MPEITNEETNEGNIFAKITGISILYLKRRPMAMSNASNNCKWQLPGVVMLYNICRWGKCRSNTLVITGIEVEKNNLKRRNPKTQSPDKHQTPAHQTFFGFLSRKFL